MSVTYDTGALLAAERDDRIMWARHRRLLAHRETPIVPVAVLAQAWRGGAGRQTLLARLLASCEVEQMTDEQARRIGELMGLSRHDDVVDVAVVEGAIRRGGSVVTSDPADIEKIANAIGVQLRIVTV